MPTPKQVRRLYKRLRVNLYRLQTALNEAHGYGVIEYDSSKYQELGPCSALEQCRQRIEITTEKARAQAMKDEIMDSIR